ncbi:MFS transporter [Alicyclobacillus acidiphilus]|uniref:MFS transporter n=1 Tax=Alicyclobacillus acidiphilus TaxID=182455 RepID=UPI0008319811|nr:MFS transporter [Alicyclobacillus acidiphilus]
MNERTPRNQPIPEALWKNADFNWLMAGRTVSELGTAMTTFVIPWLLLQITGSGTQTGIAFAIGFIPYLCISFPAGVWADRFDRKALMIVADAARLVLLLSIPATSLVTGFAPLCLLYLVQAGLSGFSAVFDASYAACLPSIVTTNQLRGANNLLQTSLSMSKSVGPIIGGIAIAWIAPANTILFDVGSYVVSILTIFPIKRAFSAKSHKISEYTAKKNSFLRDVREGVGTVWAIQPIRYMMVFSTLVNFVGPGMDVALLYRIQHELVLPAWWAGIMMGGLSAGMLLGSFIHRWTDQRVSVDRWLTISSILQVVPPIVLSVSNNPIIMCGMQIFIGVLLVAWNVQSATLRQTLIPDHLLGRTSSAFRLSAWISIPLGDGIAGIISQHVGTRAYFAFAGCVLALVAAIKVSVQFVANRPIRHT